MRSLSMFPFIIAVAIGLNACTYEQKGTQMEAEFHPPLTYSTWETERFTSRENQPVCAISSGYKGLTVYLRRKQGDELGIAVQSDRKLQPGTALTVNVNRHHYRTSENFFSADESVRLAEDLATQGKAYLEWSEPHSGGKGRLRTNNIIKLDGFAAQFEQCRKSLLSQPTRTKGE